MTCPALRVVLAGYAAAVLWAALGGSVLAHAGRQQVRLHRPAPGELSRLADQVRDIVRQNGRVWLSVCAGVASFGALGFAVVVTNAFRFGFDAATVARSAPAELQFLLPHGALEFLAFTLAAAACQHLAWQLFELLALDRRTGRAVPSLVMLAASAAVGVAAAFVEAVAQAARAA